MEIKPIKTKTTYRMALKEIESLMTARPNTAEGDHSSRVMRLLGEF